MLRAVSAMVIVGMLVALLGTSIGPSAAAFQADSATPWPEAMQEAFVDGGVREFRAAEMRLMGPAAISVAVYRFRSDDAATDALPFLSTMLLDQLGGDDLRPTSAPEIGDETVAFAGKAPGTDDTSYPVGLVFWRDGPVVFAAFSAGLSGEQLPSIFDIARTIDERTPSAPVASPADQEMRTGGVWDRLPVLDDMPNGFVFDGDKPLEPAT